MRLIDADLLRAEFDNARVKIKKNPNMAGMKSCVDSVCNVLNLVVDCLETKEYVPLGYHNQLLETEERKRLAAKKEQKQTEETNRQILENYVPKNRWVIAREQNPNRNGTYLVCDRTIPFGTIRYNAVYYDILSGWDDETMHWMWSELPDIPVV